MWSRAGFMSQVGFASAVPGQGWGVLAAQAEPSVMWLLIPDLFQVTQLYPGSSSWVINI